MEVEPPLEEVSYLVVSGEGPQVSQSLPGPSRRRLESSAVSSSARKLPQALCAAVAVASARPLDGDF